ncbi:MAG TPA: xanthine dehydrogenase family protein molybdopterin-binding subunit [Conexivisphaerales archaeon]|nr:xanthine dehydrogenase family protein molybdopterin-binding subunit [Conexivisphaerales archaeon]
MTSDVSQFLKGVKEQGEQGKLVYVGESLARIDGLEKVLGKPVYTGDMLARGTVHAKLFHSSLPHGKLIEVDLSAAKAMPRVLDVLTWKDIPGINESSAVIPDRPFFASSVVRSTADILGAVVAETEGAAREAAEAVKVTYAPLPAVFDPIEAMKPDAVRVHEGGNVAKEMRIRKGDVEKGFANSSVVVEKTFRTQFQDATPMETEVGMAVPAFDGSITVIGSMQSPHHTRAALMKMLNLPADRVRVVQAVTGGAFGPKSDETPYDVCGTAALAALRLKRPVYCAMDREESMVMHTKRHPYVITHRTGASADGRLQADEVELYLDAGAYASLGVFVIGRGIFHCTGAYEVPNVKADSYLVYTNNTYAGSFRGFGGPQAVFAIESQMEDLARKLSLDPLEFRLKNMLVAGKRNATNHLIDGSCGLPQCVEKVVTSSDYWNKRKVFADQVGRLKKGMGMALLMHGNSLGPEGNDYGAVLLEVGRDGVVTVGTGLTEFGTGAVTGLIQVAAATLGVPLSWFRLARPDTSRHRESGPTVASRTVVVGGNAALVAAERIRKRLVLVAADVLMVPEGRISIRDGVAFDETDSTRSIGWAALAAEAHRRGVKMSEDGFFMAPPTPWDTETGQGSPYLQYTWGALIVEIELDEETGVYQVTDVHAAYDVGKAINPTGVIGQIYGGTVQGMGYAMMEELVHRDGKVVNHSLADYYIPTSMDIPKSFHSFIVEVPGPLGPYGAKIVAEPPIVLPAPAIRNAILNAAGVAIDDLPITSEKVLMAIKKARAAKYPS